MISTRFSDRSGCSGYKLELSLLLIMLIAVAPQMPAQKASAVESSRPAMIGQLMERALERGRIPVIVGLSIPGVFEGKGEAQTSENERALAIEQSQSRLLEQMIGYDIGSVKRFSYIPFVALSVNAAGLQQLASLPEVSSIEEDEYRTPALKESIPLIGAPAAWSYGYTGAGQTIAVIDSGIDKYHPFLSGKVVEEACFSTSAPGFNVHSLCPSEFPTSTVPNSALDCGLAGSGCFHGTHVAGIAAGKGRPISGVAPDASLIAIQAFSQIENQAVCGGPTSCILAADSDVLQGLEYIYGLRKTYSIAAVNMSLGGGDRFDSGCDKKYQFYFDAFGLLRAAGIGVIVASGNDSAFDGLSAPACISNSISVGSTTDGSGGTTADHVSTFSNSASYLSLLAPGEWITSSMPGGSMLAERGTSMAAPHVAGAWAVLKSKSPGAGVDEILAVLRSTGKPILDSRNGVTVPRIQLDKAVDALLPPNRVTLAASPSTCTIPASEDYCAVRLTATNPQGAPLQIWMQGPNSSSQQMVLGTFIDKVFSFTWSWIELGQSSFYIYDVSENPRRLLAHLNAGAVLSPPSIISEPSSCLIDPWQGTCSVTINIYNPPGQPVQLRVRDKTGIEKAVTGTVTEYRYPVVIPWVQAGTYVFTLYDVSTQVARAIDRILVTGFAP